MKLIFAVLDVSLTMSLTRCYKTEGFFTFIPYSGYGTQDKIIFQLFGYDIYFRVSFAAVWHRYQ